MANNQDHQPPLNEKTGKPGNPNSPPNVVPPDSTRPPTPRHKGRFPPGQSGNPKGRPPKIYNQSSLLVTSLLEESATAITHAAIKAATDGNALAIKLCLDRLSPAPQTRSVRLTLPTPKPGPDRYATTLLADHTAILAAVVEGSITPDEGERISGLIEARRRSWEATKLADRMDALEDSVEAVKNSKGTRPKVIWDSPLSDSKEDEWPPASDSDDALNDDGPNDAAPDNGTPPKDGKEPKR